jgi:hypothetical protein
VIVRPDAGVAQPQGLRGQRQLITAGAGAVRRSAL